MSEAADIVNEIARIDLELMAVKRRVASMELRADGHDSDLRSLDGKLERIRLELEQFHRVVVSIHEAQASHGKLLQAIATKVGVAP